MMLAIPMLLIFFSLITTGSAKAVLRTSRSVSDRTNDNRRNMARMLKENTEDNLDGGLSERLLEKLKCMVGKRKERKEGEKRLLIPQSSLYKLWVEGTNIRTQTEKRDKIERGLRNPEVPRKNSYFSK